MSTNKMASTIVFAVLVSFLALSCTGQQLHVKHAPPYIVFQQQTPDSPVSASNLHNIIASPLGLTKQKNSVIQSKSVLKRPKANVLITVVTHKDQGEMPIESMAKFPMDWDTPFVDVETLMNNLQGTFLDKEPVMLDLVSNNQFFDVKTSSELFQTLPASFTAAKERLSDPDSFLSTPAGQEPASLNASLNTDGGLMVEMQMLQDVVNKLNANSGKLATGAPDLLSFMLTGLKDIGHEYGADSEQTREAQQLVAKHLDKMTEELKKIYKGNVMVEVLTVPDTGRPHVRKARSLMAVGDSVGAVDPSKLNLALEWDQDFPAAFNICLFLVLTLVLTVMFIAYGIWNMNPNLESILYRVPQDDAKKMN